MDKVDMTDKWWDTIIPRRPIRLACGIENCGFAVIRDESDEMVQMALTLECPRCGWCATKDGWLYFGKQVEGEVSL